MNSIRFSGLASGMDTESIVKQLMQTERLPLDRLKQDKQVLEWQRDDYRSLNKEIEQFRTYLFDKMLNQNTFVPKSVESSDTSVVTATANADAPNMTTSIQIDKLATSTQWKSSGAIDINANWKNGLSFDVNGKATLTFKKSDVNGVDSEDINITINETDTLDNIVNKFNTSSLGITAMKIDQTIVFTNKSSGSGNYGITIQDPNVDDTTKTFMSNIGFQIDPTNKIVREANTGTDAELYINGVFTKQKSNTFQISGVSYSIKATGSASISTNTDVDSAINNIKEFVQKYNELLDKVNGKLNQRPDRNYRPLTDDQKKAMGEKEIELWEERAKSGLLNRDPIITGGFLTIRTALYTKVDPGDKGIDTNFDTLMEIGITTTKNFLDGGKLEVNNESELRKALETNPSAVYDLFAKTTDSDLASINRDNLTADQRQTKFNESGLIVRIREILYDTINKVEEKAGNQYSVDQNYTIGKSIGNINDKIDDFERRLTQIESRYWSQFTAMEKAMQRANEQSGWLMQQLSGMQ